MFARFLTLIALLLGIPANAGVFAHNDPADHLNKVQITVTHEWVAGLVVQNLSGIVTIPPRTLHQWHTILACHDGIGEILRPWVAANVFFTVLAHPHSAQPNCKIVSAWGTRYTETHLPVAQQTNNHFQNTGDLAFDDFSFGDASTNVKWILRGTKNCWPGNGLAAAGYLRLEAMRVTTQGLGQISVITGQVTENTTSDGPLSLKTQVKAFSRAGQPDVSEDHIRVAVWPGINEGLVGVLTSSDAAGSMHCSGWELRPQ